MNELKKKFETTKLAGKLIRRIALICLVGLIVSFGLSYALFWPQLRDEAHSSTETANRYITQSINETFIGLAGFADYITASQPLSESLDAFYAEPSENARLQVKYALTQLLAASPNVRAIALQGIDSGGYFQAGLLGGEDRSLMQSEWFSEHLTEGYGHAWSTFYVSDVEQPENTLLRISRRLIREHEYAIAIFYDATGLMENIDALAQSAYTGYLLAAQEDGSPEVFFAQGKLGNAEALLAGFGSDGPYSTRDVKGHYFMTTIPASEWIFAGFIDNATFNKPLVPFVWLLFISFVILGLLILLLFIPSINQLLSPLGELERTMKNVSTSGPDYYSEVETDDEIGNLSDVFNDMLDELRINAEHQLDQQEREQRLTYNLMVSQINSHFFYNTLNVVSSLAREGRTEDVARANNALITIFQDCLRPQSAAVGDTVTQEKSIVECYWVIEALDPANEGELLWDIPDELMDKRIPKNIIQPLVENALFHGLDDPMTAKKTGWIRVALRQEDRMLVLTVTNNGTPIPEETLERLNTSGVQESGGRHIGLANIRRRLEMIYGDRAGLYISSGDETTVTIRMPDEL